MLTAFRGKSLIINQLAVLIVLGMLVGISVTALSGMNRSAQYMIQGKDVVADILPPPLYLIEAHLVSIDIVRADAAARQPLLDKLKSLQIDYNMRNNYWDLGDLDPVVKSSLMGAQRKYADLFWREVHEGFLPAIQFNDMEAIQRSAQTMREYYEAHRKGVDATVSLASGYAEDKLNDLNTSAQNGYRELGIAALLGMVLVLLVAIPTLNRIYRSLHEANAALAAIASGDLTRPMLAASNNEIGELAGWFNKHSQNLKNVVVDVHYMSDQVSASANDIAAAVEEQAAITSQQSASLNEITATMEELSVSSSQIADNANAVANTSKSTLGESERGVLALNQLQEKMGEITSDNNRNISEILELDCKSKEIGKIMGIINDIADQTKMIAFNAAIEASSSGEAGKRFGVVAVEIRRLAANVTESTGEIESKIEEIQQSINRLVIASENGSRVINEGAQAAMLTTGELMSILQGAKLAAESAQQISLATQQQKSASNQVLKALTEISQGLHQSSASIRQTSMSTHGLTGMSDNLMAKLGVFHLGDSIKKAVPVEVKVETKVDEQDIGDRYVGALR
ncbi:MAG: methyl-accepting chemotaxis protein [Gallionella sp.]|nr:methyl-accepting chemotaxis protein [Gallionella sp.]